MNDQHGHDQPTLFSALDDEPGPAAPIPDALAQAIARRVVERALLGPIDSTASADAGPAPTLSAGQSQRIARDVTARIRRRDRIATWQAAAAVLLASLALGSGAWAMVRVWLDPVVIGDAAAAPAITPQAARRKVAAQPKPAATEPRAVDAPQASPPLAPVEPVQAPTVVRGHGPEPRVDELLERANQARGRRQWDAAARLYAKVIDLEAKREPASTLSDPAYAATLAVATLELEHAQRPRSALDRYQRALRARPRGALSEEARYGIVNALHALGDVEAERSALEDFLRQHPRSLFADQARARLARM